MKNKRIEEGRNYKMEQRELRKLNKGITLIALVITIIVLLILAGVSIAMLTGENGILTQANNAKRETEKGSGNISKEELKEILEKYFTDVPEEIPEEIETVELTQKEEYGSEEIKLSEIWKGEFEEEEAKEEPIEETESYVVNYADTNGDGKADGIIFADLAVGGSGQWGDSWGDYSVPTASGLKEYYIANENYSDSRFGNRSGKLIVPVAGTSGNDRFYIMALEDVNPGTYYCWYAAAYGKLNNTVGGTTNDFGKGKENTEYVMNKWTNKTWGAQNTGSYADMWGVIQTQVNQGWFVPSKSEWAAFAGSLGITSSNYSSYGLKKYYWSSLQYDTSIAYYAGIGGGVIFDGSVNSSRYVRLCATF